MCILQGNVNIDTDAVLFVFDNSYVKQFLDKNIQHGYKCCYNL